MSDTVVDLRRLPRDRDHPVDLAGDAAMADAIAEALDLLGLRKLRLTGTLAPSGRRDWRFKGRLGATVVQPCVVTLEPVTTRIDTDVMRHYSAEFRAPELEEAEMPEDDSVEPLPDRLDLVALVHEALSLSLPLYPRAPDAADDAPAARIFGPPGVAPMDDEAAKPLAGLAALRDRLTEDRSPPPEAGDPDDPDPES